MRTVRPKPIAVGIAQVSFVNTYRTVVERLEPNGNLPPVRRWNRDVQARSMRAA